MTHTRSFRRWRGRPPPRQRAGSSTTTSAAASLGAAPPGGLAPAPATRPAPARGSQVRLAAVAVAAVLAAAALTPVPADPTAGLIRSDNHASLLATAAVTKSLTYTNARINTARMLLEESHDVVADEQVRAELARAITAALTATVSQGKRTDPEVARWLLHAFSLATAYLDSATAAVHASMHQFQVDQAVSRHQGALTAAREAIAAATDRMQTSAGAVLDNQVREQLQAALHTATAAVGTTVALNIGALDEHAAYLAQVTQSLTATHQQVTAAVAAWQAAEQRQQNQQKSQRPTVKNKPSGNGSGSAGTTVPANRPSPQTSWQQVAQSHINSLGGGATVVWGKNSVPNCGRSTCFAGYVTGSYGTKTINLNMSGTPDAKTAHNIKAFATHEYAHILQMRIKGIYTVFSAKELEPLADCMARKLWSGYAGSRADWGCSAYWSGLADQVLAGKLPSR